MSGGDGFSAPGVSVIGLTQDPVESQENNIHIALQAMSTLLNNTDLSTYMQLTLWPAWGGGNAPSPGKDYQVLGGRKVQVTNSKVEVDISEVSSPAFLVPILRDLSLCRVMAYMATIDRTTDLGVSLRTAITKSIEILSNQLLSESSVPAGQELILY
jgi:hypothetical protein